MNSTTKEIKNIFNFSISTWVNFILGFFLSFVLTRIYIPEVLGVINLFYSTVSTLLAFFCFGLDSALIRFFYKESEKGRSSNFVFSLMMPCLLAIVLVGGISILFWSKDVAGFFLGRNETLLCILIVLSVISQLFLRYLNIIYRMESKIREFNIQSIAINIATKFSVLFGVLVDKSTPIYALLFSALTVSLVTIYYSFNQRKEWIPNECSFNYRGYREVFQFAFWDWISLFVIQVYVLSSQLIITNKLDLHSVGIYSSAGIFTAVITVARGGFCTYWSAFMYKNYSDPEKQNFIRRMHDVILFSCIVLCSMLFTFRSVLYLFIGKEFRSSMAFFSLLIYFPLLQTVQETVGYGISIKKKNHILTIIYSLTLMINIVLGLYLVETLGLIGVAWGNFISALFLFVIVGVISQRMYISILSTRRTILGVLLLLVEGVAPVFINNDYKLAVFMFFVLVLSAYLYKNVLLYCKCILMKVI